MNLNLTTEEAQSIKELLVLSSNKCHVKLAEAGVKGNCKESDLDSLVMRHAMVNQLLGKLKANTEFIDSPQIDYRQQA